MGLRAYFLVKADERMEQRDFVNKVMELQEIPGVDYVDPVIDNQYDMVIMVDAPITVTALAKKIEAMPWVEDLKVMRMVGIFERHRSIPAPIFELVSSMS